MINTLDPASQRFLSGLGLIQQRADRAQRELTSGFRINTVSDDPGQVVDLLQSLAGLDRTRQIGANLGRVKTETDAAEAALQNAVKLVDRAQTLGVQGQNGFASTQDAAQTRQNLAGELGAVLQQLVGVSQTNVDGRFLFSGDADQQTPYSIDLTQTNAISAYGGTAATRRIENPDGTLFAVSKTAQEIFDSPAASQNVFHSIDQLRVALLNNDQAGINAALPDVQSAGKYLNTQLAFYGTVQNRVADGLDSAANFETQLQTQISSIRDADLAQSLTELTQAKTQQDAALASRAKLPQTSLFNFLA